MPKNDIFLAGPRSWKTSIFSTFQKVFQNDENYHQLTTGHLKCKYLFIWVRNMQVCEMPKMTFFSQVMRNFNFFDSPKSLSIWWKTPPVDPRTLKCKYLLIWMKNMQVCEMPKMTFFLQVRGHENLHFFWLFEKLFKMMKSAISWPQDTWNVNICSFGRETCKFVKCPKMTFFSQVRSHEKLQFLI